MNPIVKQIAETGPYLMILATFWKLARATFRLLTDVIWSPDSKPASADAEPVMIQARVSVMM